VQRTGASRFAQRQIERQGRLAPVADLCIRRGQKEKTVPAERSALNEAQRAWLGA